jgi:hypothetical protein
MYAHDHGLICEYCDQPATRRAKDSGEPLCRTDANQYQRWWQDTRPLTKRDITELTTN